MSKHTFPAILCKIVERVLNQTLCMCFPLIILCAIIIYNFLFFRSATARNLLPSLQDCYNIFYKKRYNPMSEKKSSMKSLKIKLQNWEHNTDGCAAINSVNDVIIITLVTPFMKCVHSLQGKSDGIFFLEKIVSSGKPNLSMYILSFPSAIGELPICYIIISSSRSAYLKKGLQQLLSLNEGIFLSYVSNDSNYPKYVVVNDNNVQENIGTILKDIWPSSKIFVSPQHVLKCIWLLIRDYSATVSETIFLAFKNVLTATTKDEALKSFGELQSLSSPDLFSNLSTFWTNNETWCLCYFREQVSSNCLEKSYISYFIQEVKDMFVKSVQQFDIHQLVDLIITRLDTYYNKRIVDIIDRNFHISRLRNLLPETSILSENIYVIDKNTFLIKVSKENNFIVDTTLGFCTCPFGMCGTICEHMRAVVLYYIQNIDGTNYIHNTSDYQNLLDIFSGKKVVANNSGPAKELEKEVHTVSEEKYNTLDDNSHRKLEKCSEQNDLFSTDDNVLINSSNAENDTFPQNAAVNLGSDCSSQSEELTATDIIRIMNTEENPFSKDLVTIFKDIIDRVQNNPDLQQAADVFCQNYKTYCTSNFSLMLSLDHFSELLKSSS